MKITATEIREKTFEKIFRGYDKDEVGHFLLALSKDWEALLEEKRKIEEALELSQKEAKKLKDVEESLFRTLKTAEDTGASIIEEATVAADEIMRAAKENSEGMLIEAKRKSTQLVSEAEKKSALLLSDAEAKSTKILENIKSDVVGLVRNYEHLISQRELIVRNLHQLTENIQDNITVSNETFKKVNLNVYEEMVQNFAKPKTAIIIPDEVSVGEKVSFSNEPMSEDAQDLHNTIPEQEIFDEITVSTPNETPVERTEDSNVTAAREFDSKTTEIESSPVVSDSSITEVTKTDVQDESPKNLEEPKKKGGSFFDQFD
jgi:cell division initiation protein